MISLKLSLLSSKTKKTKSAVGLENKRKKIFFSLSYLIIIGVIIMVVVFTVKY